MEDSRLGHLKIEREGSSFPSLKSTPVRGRIIGKGYLKETGSKREGRGGLYSKKPQVGRLGHERLLKNNEIARAREGIYGSRR